ncbi:MAG: histidinol-phosphate transaminase [Rhodospirillales bacterium]|nr:histidinol-phosphate transaminase [Rhodospirillales bacterium]
MTSPVPKPGILEISPYVGGKSSVAGGVKPIKLSSNEGALGPSPKAIEAATRAATQMHRYPDGGAGALRAAIGKRFSLDPERIVCGAGSDELIALLVKSYAGPGDEVLYSQYGFVMYPIAAHSAGAVPVQAPEKGYRTDIDAMIAKAGPKTKICFVANPNNPTGSYVTGAELKRLRDGLPPHVLLIVDAAYAEYVSRNDYTNGAELVDAGENTVMLRTFSKIFALGGMRLGWAYAPAKIVDVLNRVRGPFNVSAAAQAAGVAAMEDLAFQEKCRAHNDRVLSWFAGEVAKLGLKTLPSVGNFVMVEFPSTGRHTAAAANEFLMSRAIIPRAVANYGLPDHLRVTIGTDDEMKAVVAALADFVK